jgi:hypothetical protein
MCCATIFAYVYAAHADHLRPVGRLDAGSGSLHGELGANKSVAINAQTNACLVQGLRATEASREAAAARVARRFAAMGPAVSGIMNHVRVVVADNAVSAMTFLRRTAGELAGRLITPEPGHHIDHFLFDAELEALDTTARTTEMERTTFTVVPVYTADAHVDVLGEHRRRVEAAN